jgi:Sigma-70 factor, region 1.2
VTGHPAHDDVRPARPHAPATAGPSERDALPDVVRSYLLAIGQVPLLTPAQEIALA